MLMRLVGMLGICGRYIGCIGGSVGGSMRWRGGGRGVGFGGGGDTPYDRRSRLIQAA